LGVAEEKKPEGMEIGGKGFEGCFRMGKREKMNLPLASVRDDFYPDFPIMRFQQGLSDPSGIRTLSPSTR